MADSILRLKVESQEYDNKLKQAAQGLTRYADECRKVGGTLEVVEKDTLEYVRALGQMDTTSRTATGKLAEMKKTFVELSAQYKQMTDAEKASPFGKALAASLDELNPRIMEAKQQLDDINKSMIGASSGGGGLFDGISSRFDGMLQVFGGNLMTKAFDMGAGAVTNFIGTIKEAAAQGIEMAKAGEGIRVAFERLNRPDLLNGLREATHNTVTDIELMKAAVKFNDFKLPLSELGTMLAFAQQKAKDTGQSVDYMVDSIVTGLGRQSLMILDNLGLSADQIKTKMKETGDMTTAVGAIIREQMANAGEYVETAADRATQADVELKNAMEDLGQALMPLQEQGVEVFHSIEIAALKLLNDGVNVLVPALVKLKGVISDVYDAAVTDNWVTQGFISWLETGIDVSMRFIPYLKDIKFFLDAIKNGGDVGAGAAVGGAISSLIPQGGAVNSIDEIVVTGNKPKKTKSGAKKNLPEYADFNKQLFKSLSGDDLKQEIPHFSVFETFKNQAKFDPENILGSKDAWESYKDTVAGSIGSIDESMSNLTQWTANFDPFKDSMDKMNKSAKESKMAFGAAANAAGALGSALAGMEDPGVRAAGLVLQSIASIALGFAQAAASPLVTGTGWGWLAFVAAGAAAMATTISTIHQLSGYEQGGIVKGNSYSGDNIMANGGTIGLNAGELVLTKAMQGNLASQMQGGVLQNMNIAGRIKGTDIILSIDRSLKLEGKQLLTWGR